MNSSKPHTHRLTHTYIHTHVGATAALHQHPRCLAWQQTTQETKTRLSAVLPSEDNVVDSEMSRGLEHVRYCFKIDTIEEDWITKMRLGRDEWSRPWLDESWSPLQIALIISECITTRQAKQPGLVLILFIRYMSYSSLILCQTRWRSGWHAETIQIDLRIFKLDMKKWGFFLKRQTETSQVFSKYRWHHTTVSLQRVMTNDPVIEPPGQVQHSAANELNCWLTQAEHSFGLMSSTS